jgi:hypothetical protein
MHLCGMGEKCGKNGSYETESNMEELNRKEYGTYIDSAKKGEKFNEGEINKQL